MTMNYYTETIPVALAEKLKEKGMPMEVWNGTIQRIPYICIMEESSFVWLDKKLVRYSIPSFGACFDWLMEKGLRIVIEPSLDFANERITDTWDCDIVKVGAFSSQPETAISQCDTWHGVAEAAINKALELI